MDFDHHSVDNLKGRIMKYSKFYYSDGFHIMETFGMKTCCEYRARLDSNGQVLISNDIKEHLMNSFISNSEYLKKFLYLEKRIDNIKKLGI